MILTQLKIAVRGLWKNKDLTVIKVLGLALGLTCAFLMLTYSWYEFNYDTFHEESDDLYRVEYHIQLDNEINLSRIPAPIGPRLTEYFPEIKSAARFFHRTVSTIVSRTADQYEVENVFFADSSARDIFTFEFVAGDPSQALINPKSVVLTEEMATLFFGHTDVLGEPLELSGTKGFTIAGIIKDWPSQSHIDFNMLLPYEAMIDIEPEHARQNVRSVLENNWIASHSYTYVRLYPNQDLDLLHDKFKAFIQEYGYEQMRDKQSFTLMPVQDLHIYSEGGPAPSANIDYLYLFIMVGLLIIGIACINFVNLSTAGALSRAREVGVRKVLGAGRPSLIGQFLAESSLLTGISFVIGIATTYALLPSLNALTGQDIPQEVLSNPMILVTGLGLYIATVLLSGTYPAFFISRFKPAIVLRGQKSGQGNEGKWLKSSLIVLQFAASIIFIAGAFIVFKQLEFLKNRPLGFNESLIVNIPLQSENNINSVFRPGDATLRQRMNAFDESLTRLAGVKAVTQGANPPGVGAVLRKVWNDHVKEEDNFYAGILSVDYDYVETFQIPVLAGRDFDESFGLDHTSSFLINERAMDALGWRDLESALGQNMVLEGKEGQVVGVLKDFHFSNLRNEIDALIMEVRPGAFGYFSVRLDNENVSAILQQIEEQWITFFPEKVFEFTFLEESLNDQYAAENRLSQLTFYFAIIAIIISSFGLLGLAALMTRKRFKEIGIRKVLGASVKQILILISRDFLLLILWATCIAVPITWYLLDDWLTQFAFRIAFPWWTLGISALLVVVLAFFTVSTQSIKAAIANPVEAIRDE